VKVGGYRFSPGWMPTALTVIFLPLFVWLGLWQLDRAVEKQAQLDAFEALGRLPPVALAGDAQTAPLRHRKVTAGGEYDAGRQYLLDNRILDRRPGYHVLTPLRLAAGKAVLVNRGWIPLGASRQERPDIGIENTRVTVVGQVHPEPEAGLVLDDAAGAETDWPRLVQRIDFERMGHELGVPLVPVLVLLDAGQAEGYVRKWRPDYVAPPDKNRAYAAQWFSFAVLLIVLYVGLNTRRAANGNEEQGR